MSNPMTHNLGETDLLTAFAAMRAWVFKPEEIPTALKWTTVQVVIDQAKENGEDIASAIWALLRHMKAVPNQ